MKHGLLFLLLIPSFFSCSKKPDCSDLRTGVFTIQTQNSGTVTVTRSETQSIENVPDFDQEMVNSIEWTGDCNFAIIYESGDKPTSPSADLPIDCEIVEVGIDYHIVRAKIRGSEIEADYKMVNKYR